MAEFTLSVTATDGLLPSPNLIFTPLGELSTGASTNTPQLIKAQIQNMTGFKEYPCMYFNELPLTTSTVDYHYYDDSTSTWSSGSPTDHLVSNYLSIYIPFSDYKKNYVCLKASDEQHVPNLGNGCIYYKVNDIPTKETISQYSYVELYGAKYAPIVIGGFGHNLEKARDDIDITGFLTPVVQSDPVRIAHIRVPSSTQISNLSGKKISTQVKILARPDFKMRLLRD